jgi:catechol 2,3-dioxygenase-like lactoylglutathione lyase family enzyme
MKILRLDHINIAGPLELLEACRTFYVDILGLTEGPRPRFRRRGFWLYAGDLPLVHLSESEDPGRPTGPLNHFAFKCEGLDVALARLRERGVPHTVASVPNTEETQIFVEDPAGVSIELNFSEVLRSKAS